MNYLSILVILIALGIVVSAVLLLKQSAKKFKLTDAQIKKIKQRNIALDKQEEEQNK